MFASAYVSQALLVEALLALFGLKFGTRKNSR